jgi:hypothetical protein
MMRELLLATATMLVSAVGYTTVTMAQTVLPAPTEGVIATPLPVQAANNNNNSFVIPSDGIPKPTPGTVVIHLNGRVGSVAKFWG